MVCLPRYGRELHAHFSASLKFPPRTRQSDEAFAQRRSRAISYALLRFLETSSRTSITFFIKMAIDRVLLSSGRNMGDSRIDEESRKAL